MGNENRYLLKVLIVFFLFLIISPFWLSQSLAQENLEEVCDWENIKEQPGHLSDSEYETLLRKCQNYYQQISEEIEGDIRRTEQEKDTLENQIYILNNKIKNLDYQIYQGNIMINDLSNQIEDTQSSITKTNLKIEEVKGELGSILQLRYENDKKSYLAILLAENSLSDFFNELMALDSLNVEIRKLLSDIKNLKTNLENQKETMDQEKEEMEGVVTMQKLQKEESNQVKQQQQYYLDMTEQEYQVYLREKAETEKRVAEIRARIFELVGVSEAPTFGEALEIAEYVESLTGVRPAFLLAVMKQESNIGKNVGQCYLKNPSTGAGMISYNGKSVDRVMKPTRDVQPFLTITKELGRDPYNTLVSCPMSFGYGGAMGPAQFIPSTWMVYRERLKTMTGRFADPWNIRDAFLAAGLYLSDYGAANQTYNSEWKAAMIYFSGSTNPQYSFYGNNVLAIAKNLQEDINTIKSLD